MVDPVSRWSPPLAGLACSVLVLPWQVVDSSWSFEIMRLDLFDWIGHRPQFLLLCLFLAFPLLVLPVLLSKLSLWSQGHKKWPQSSPLTIKSDRPYWPISCVRGLPLPFSQNRQSPCRSLTLDAYLVRSTLRSIHAHTQYTSYMRVESP